MVKSVLLIKFGSGCICKSKVLFWCVCCAGRKCFLKLLLIKKIIVIPSACCMLNSLCLNANGLISHVTGMG